ncbi:MAG: 3-deoxy-7-phosphoheptulonate synthase [bacterium]|nr:3-deoxy-7-phosphoheptulonate synthase [bacterium]
MIIVMGRGTGEEQLQIIIDEIKTYGYDPHVIRGTDRTVVGAVGDERGKARLQALESFDGVEQVIPILKPYKLAGTEIKQERSVVELSNGLKIGGGHLAVMAGPCSVENEEQLLETARQVKAAGANVLRGGAFKPRTSPYAFQGLAEEGLKIMAAAREETGLPIITEVIAPEDVDLVAEYADIVQVGARNMSNFALLRRLGGIRKPVMLKRGMAATVEEFLMSAEYILSEGNYDVILCERGIRTFETATRFTFDINAIPLLHNLTHLPVIADPSHATGHWRLVEPIAKAALAAGADGLMIEVHTDPIHAFSDGAQSLKPEKFRQVMANILPYAELGGLKLPEFD